MLFPKKPQGAPKKRQIKRKYLYTKPYKERNRANDIGMDLPRVQRRKLNFPVNPLYYIVIKEKSKPGDPFFNLLNKDYSQLQKVVQEVQKSRTKSSQNSQEESVSLRPPSLSFDLRSSLFDTQKSSEKALKSLSKYFSEKGSINNSKYKTPTEISLDSDPFNRGFTVTSGPRRHSSLHINSSHNGSLKLGTLVQSLMSHSEHEAKSHIHQINNQKNSQIYSSNSKRPSV